MSVYQPMIGFLRSAENLLVTGHLDPDADCLGSMLGLYHLFGGADRGWQLALADDIPHNLRFFPGFGLIQRPPLSRPPAAVLLVDCGETRRAGEQWLAPYAQLPHYCLDHHISNSFSGALAVVEPQASSAGEIVAALGEAAGIAPGLDAATCLYAAIIADTGGFRYLNTTPRAMALASQLLAVGVDKEMIRIQIFESRSPAAIAMLRTALANLRIEPGGQICYTLIRHADILAHGAVKGDLHNIANYTLFPAGVKVGLFFEEYADHVKISLRGRRGWHVDKLAQAWGGGGHALAAGCQLPGDLDTVLPLVLEKVRGMAGDEKAHS